MATTGELRVIIEELELVDIGDAASYLGEEEAAAAAARSQVSEQTALACADSIEDLITEVCTGTRMR